MVIEDWELLLGALLIALPHMLSLHHLSNIGSIFLALSGIWLIGKWFSKIRGVK